MLANKQEQWNADPFDGEEEDIFESVVKHMGVVARGVEDDLLNKSEESTIPSEVLKYMNIYVCSYA